MIERNKDVKKIMYNSISDNINQCVSENISMCYLKYTVILLIFTNIL